MRDRRFSATILFQMDLCHDDEGEACVFAWLTMKYVIYVKSTDKPLILRKV